MIEKKLSDFFSIIKIKIFRIKKTPQLLEEFNSCVTN